MCVYVYVGVKKTDSKYSAVAFRAIADRPTTAAAAAPCKSTAGSCKSKDIRWKQKMHKVGKDGKAQMPFGFGAFESKNVHLVIAPEADDEILKRLIENASASMW